MTDNFTLVLLATMGLPLVVAFVAWFHARRKM